MLADLEADPYPTYARLRKEKPVLWLPEVRQWLVTRWSDVHTVLTDVDRFTTDQPGSPMIDVCGGKPLLFREGEPHRDIRKAIQNDFTPDTAAHPTATGIANALLPNGRTELSATYFEPVAVATSAALLGLDPGTVHRWGTLLTEVANNLGRDPRLFATAAAVLADDASVVLRLRERSDNSLITHLLGPRDEPRPDSDVVPVLKHLTLSALEPGWLAGWTLLALWSTPDQFAAVRNDRALLGSAVREALRWSSPVGVLGRRTTCAVTLSGQDIPAGATIAAAVASANRDEAVFPEPDLFDINRDTHEHLAFGAGPHRCPAPPFVIAVARTTLDVLLDRLPQVRPAPTWRPTQHGWKLRPPGPLDAVWNMPRSW